MSKCDSFEYLSGEEYDRTAPKSTTSRSITPNSDPEPSKRNEAETLNVELTPRIDTTTTDTDGNGISQKTSKTSCSEPLGKLISKQQRHELNRDLEKSINLIQRLMKSSRYDEVTKKYYLKKIMQKMIDQHSSETSEASLIPSESNKHGEASCKGETKTSPIIKNSSTNSNESRKSTSTERDVEAYKEKILQENIPWVPAERTGTKRQSQLQVHTFIEEVQPSSTEAVRKPKPKYSVETVEQDKECSDGKRDKSSSEKISADDEGLN